MPSPSSWKRTRTSPERLLWVGPDDRGLELEIIASIEPDYLLVIHVMPNQFRRRTP